MSRCVTDWRRDDGLFLGVALAVAGGALLLPVGGGALAVASRRAEKRSVFRHLHARLLPRFRQRIAVSAHASSSGSVKRQCMCSGRVAQASMKWPLGARATHHQAQRVDPGDQQAIQPGHREK